MFDNVKRVQSGETLCDIGQITLAEKRILNKLVRDGTVRKWRGHWYPDPHWPEGLGPLKTCYELAH